MAPPAHPSHGGERAVSVVPFAAVWSISALGLVEALWRPRLAPSAAWLLQSLHTSTGEVLRRPEPGIPSNRCTPAGRERRE